MILSLIGSIVHFLVNAYILVLFIRMSVQYRVDQHGMHAARRT